MAARILVMLSCNPHGAHIFLGAGLEQVCFKISLHALVSTCISYSLQRNPIGIAVIISSPSCCSAHGFMSQRTVAWCGVRGSYGWFAYVQCCRYLLHFLAIVRNASRIPTISYAILLHITNPFIPSHETSYILMSHQWNSF